MVDKPSILEEAEILEPEYFCAVFFLLGDFDILA
jgi:hypothetical protein